MSLPRTFVLLTPEYPPGCGGVGDYVALLAEELASAGDRVVVQTRRGGTAVPRVPGVEVELLPDDFGPQSRRLLARAWARLPRGAVVFAQYVPQGFGWKGANLAFARFLGSRRERLWFMFHEIVYPFNPGQRWQLDALALATRLMLRFSTEHAERGFMSTPAWEPLLARYGREHLPREWLPIPATIAPARFDPLPEVAKPTVAHFGTYGALVAGPLERILVPLVAAHGELRVALIGRGSDAFASALGERHPAMHGRLRATGPATPEQVSRELASAWATVFPFLEGVTTRRTSFMSALAAGAVVVTTDAWCTESVWRRSGAVELFEPDRPAHAVETLSRLLGADAERADLRRRARSLYAERFAVEHVVRRLRELYDAGRARH
jgi:glycosyltransferase involved in cell wall biosynthesis